MRHPSNNTEKKTGLGCYQEHSGHENSSALLDLCPTLCFICIGFYSSVVGFFLVFSIGLVINDGFIRNANTNKNKL